MITAKAVLVTECQLGELGQLPRGGGSRTEPGRRPMADQPAQGFGRDSIAALGNSMSKAPEERETVQRAGQFKDLTVQQSWR